MFSNQWDNHFSDTQCGVDAHRRHRFLGLFKLVGSVNLYFELDRSLGKPFKRRAGPRFGPGCRRWLGRSPCGSQCPG